MSQSTRAQLEALKESLIRTGGTGGKTTAEDLRTFMTAVIDSLLNILDDSNAVEGYPQLNSDGHVPVSLIKDAGSPSGQKFVRDDGSFASELTGKLTLGVSGAANLNLKVNAGNTPAVDGDVGNIGTNLLFRRGGTNFALLHGVIASGSFTGVHPTQCLRVKDENGNDVNLAIAV